MARTQEQSDAIDQARYEAEAAVLKIIAGGQVNAAAIRDLAEAHALLTGKLTAKSV